MTLGRTGRAGGVVFGVAYLAHLLVFTRNYDDATEIAAYFRDQRPLIFLGALVAGVGAAGFVVFASRLVSAALANRVPHATVATLGAGLAFGAVLLFVAMPIHAGVGATVADRIDPDLLSVLSDISHWHVAYAMAGFAVSAATVARMASKMTLRPWLGRLSWVTAASCALYVLATPLALFLPVWVLAMAMASPRAVSVSADA